MSANDPGADAKPPSISMRVTISVVGRCTSSGVTPGCSVSTTPIPARRASVARRAASPPTIRTTSSSPARMAVYASFNSVCWGMPVCTSTLWAVGALTRSATIRPGSW